VSAGGCTHDTDPEVKANAKDLSLKAKTKDLIAEAKAKAEELSLKGKAKAKTKDICYRPTVLEEP